MCECVRTDRWLITIKLCGNGWEFGVVCDLNSLLAGRKDSAGIVLWNFG